MKDWRSNGIMVPYGFVLWALRDAMQHPSSATQVLDEFLREEFDELGDAYQRQVIDMIELHLQPSAMLMTAPYERAIRKDRPVWEELLLYLRWKREA
jgi:hypothetical protein